MKKSRVQLGLIVILILLVGSLLISFKASPDMLPFFAFKRVQEKALLQTKSSPADRVDYMSSLLDARLDELQSVFNHKNYGYILAAASRYSTLAGQITDLVVANNLTGKVPALREQFLSHQKVLDAIYVAYPKNTDNWEWKYIQDDYNYLKLYLDKLEKIK